MWWQRRTILLLFAGILVLNCPARVLSEGREAGADRSFFVGTIAVFDKTRKGPAISSYIGRDELEACGEAFLAQVRQQAEKTGQGDGGMTTLTQCQQQVLDMLISYQKERGFLPTNQEVATMLGYRSVRCSGGASSHWKKASSR